MIKSATDRFTWAGRAGRPPLCAWGVVVAVTVALLVGVLAAAPAHARTFTVNSTANPGTGGCNAAQCTLKEAVNEANGNGVSDTINFASGLGGEIDLRNTPSQGGFSILDDAPGTDLDINGPGARVLAVNGNDETRAFGIAVGANALIKGLAIKNGRADVGGGIFNRGTLSLLTSTVSSSTATAGYGGGIYNDSGSLTLYRSTVNSNASSSGGTIGSGLGGGIYNDSGGMSLTNSTVSSNTADFSGGGIFNNRGSLRLWNSTVSANTTNGQGGGIFNGGSALPTNTIIAGNTAGTDPDVRGVFSSQGYNLIGNTSGSSGWGSLDLLNRNPLLGALRNNGGPTNTHALRTGSPAINTTPKATNGCGTTITTDQRGLKRPQGTKCDTGSFEKKKRRR